jgi:hypothetical protein
VKYLHILTIVAAITAVVWILSGSSFTVQAIALVLIADRFVNAVINMWDAAVDAAAERRLKRVALPMAKRRKPNQRKRRKPQLPAWCLGKAVDFSNADIVTVREPTPSELVDFHSYVTPDKIHRLLGRKLREEQDLVGVEYANPHHATNEPGEYVGVILKKQRPRLKVMYLFRDWPSNLAWLDYSQKHEGDNA